MKHSNLQGTTNRSLVSSWRGVLLGAVLALVFVSVGVGATLAVQYGSEMFDSSYQHQAQDGNQLHSQDETGIASIAKNVSPSVVSIISESVDRNQWGQVGVRSGAGSGVIVGKDGYIMTNKHVIDGARKLQIVLSDGTVYDKVDVVSKDPLNDLAFLKIAGAKNLPVAKIGDSSSVKVGQRVVAIGNSLGQYQNTVTTGIISGTGRPIAAQAGDSVESLTDLLQTDAAINPGNSGGPLLNMAGQVIGINTAVATGAEGIGFAIPVDATKGILKQVVAGKTDPKRALLGVRYISLDAEIANQQNLDRTYGAYVTADGDNSSVQKDSPADKAGLKKGDIIIKINGKEVGVSGGLSSMVSAYSPGETVSLTYLRDGKEKTVKVELMAY